MLFAGVSNSCSSAFPILYFNRNVLCRKSYLQEEKWGQTLVVKRVLSNFVWVDGIKNREAALGKLNLTTVPHGICSAWECCWTWQDTTRQREDAACPPPITVHPFQIIPALLFHVGVDGKWREHFLLLPKTLYASVFYFPKLWTEEGLYWVRLWPEADDCASIL